jgi:RND superfamily putative drug exporter
MTDTDTSPPPRSRTARTIRRFSIPIALFWLVVAGITNVTLPPLEAVAEAHDVALSAKDAPSLVGMKHIGAVFGEFDSDSAAMIVLEGDTPLGPPAHQFYDTLITKLAADTTHVQHVQDFWGDPLTAASSQSTDGKAAYVQVYLAGNQGETLANESVSAVRDIVAHTPPPPGVRAYVTGSAALNTDQIEVGNAGVVKVTIITMGVIALALFLVYRSIVTTVLVLFTVLIELAAARGVVAACASSGLIGLSTFSVNLLTLLAIAAGTDYAIFFVAATRKPATAAWTATTPITTCSPAPRTSSWVRD